MSLCDVRGALLPTDILGGAIALAAPPPLMNYAMSQKPFRKRVPSGRTRCKGMQEVQMQLWQPTSHIW